MSHTIKNKTLSQRGNAMIYVLIALALFGFLTMTLSRSNDQADGQDIDDEQAALYATELIEYVASAQNAVDMMLASGSEIDDLNFVNPTSVGFNTTPPPNYNKVYHPQGGGLNYQPEFPEALQILPASGWFHSKLSHIEWTPTTALDVSFNALRIPEKICALINKKITGNSNIPALTVPAVSRFFEESGSNGDMLTADCPACVGHANLCVTDSTGTNYAFYNIIAAQ